MALNWQPTFPLPREGGEWWMFDCDDSGRIIFATECGNFGKMFVSKNYGETWTEVKPYGVEDEEFRMYYQVCVSGNGNFIMVLEDTNVLVSVDGGVNWAVKEDLNPYSLAIAKDNSGKAVVVSGKEALRTVDFCENFSDITPALKSEDSFLTQITMNRDASVIYLGQWIFGDVQNPLTDVKSITKNGGVSWEDLAIFGTENIKTDGTGEKLLRGSYQIDEGDGPEWKYNLNLSEDYGETFSPLGILDNDTPDMVFTNVIWADESLTNILLYHLQAEEKEYFFSNDGGITWSKEEIDDEYLDGDLIDFVASSKSGGMIIASLSDTIYICDNGYSQEEEEPIPAPQIQLPIKRRPQSPWNAISKMTNFLLHEKKLNVRLNMDFASIVRHGNFVFLVPNIVYVGVFEGFLMPVFNDDGQELFFTTKVPERWDGITNPYLTLWCALEDDEVAEARFKFQLDWINCCQTEVVLTEEFITKYVDEEILIEKKDKYNVYRLRLEIDIGAPTQMVPKRQELKPGDLISGRIRRISAGDAEIANDIIVVDYYMGYKVDKLFGFWKQEI